VRATCPVTARLRWRPRSSAHGAALEAAGITGRPAATVDRVAPAYRETFAYALRRRCHGGAAARERRDAVRGPAGESWLKSGTYGAACGPATDGCAMDRGLVERWAGIGVGSTPVRAPKEDRLRVAVRRDQVLLADDQRWCAGAGRHASASSRTSRWSPRSARATRWCRPRSAPVRMSRCWTCRCPARTG